MYTSLLDAFIADSFFSPMRTVYVVSDSQLEEIKRNQRQEELDNLEASRKRLEETYHSRIKIIDEREHELQEELKALAPAEKKTELPAEESEKCAVKA
jgi:predicted RecB family nuclease